MVYPDFEEFIASLNGHSLRYLIAAKSATPEERVQDKADLVVLKQIAKRKQVKEKQRGGLSLGKPLMNGGNYVAVQTFFRQDIVDIHPKQLVVANAILERERIRHTIP